MALLRVKLYELRHSERTNPVMLPNPMQQIDPVSHESIFSNLR